MQAKSLKLLKKIQTAKDLNKNLLGFCWDIWITGLMGTQVIYFSVYIPVIWYDLICMIEPFTAHVFPTFPLPSLFTSYSFHSKRCGHFQPKKIRWWPDTPRLPSLKPTGLHGKSVPYGKGDSYWKPPSSGDMLVFGSVVFFGKQQSSLAAGFLFDWRREWMLQTFKTPTKLSKFSSAFARPQIPPQCRFLTEVQFGNSNLYPVNLLSLRLPFVGSERS